MNDEVLVKENDQQIQSSPDCVNKELRVLRGNQMANIRVNFNSSIDANSQLISSLTVIDSFGTDLEMSSLPDGTCSDILPYPCSPKICFFSIQQHVNSSCRPCIKQI